MNAGLVKKLLEKFTLNELYEEIKGDDNFIYQLGVSLLAHKNKISVALIKIMVEQVIANSSNKEILSFIKEKILSLDGEVFSVNQTSRQKLSASTKSSISSYDDGCSRGSGTTSNARC